MATIPPIKVRPGVDSQDSQYQLGKRNFMDFDAVAAALIQLKMPFNEVPDFLETQYVNATRKLEGMPEIVIPELSEELTGLFWPLKWHSSADGSRSEYIMSKPETELYTLTKDPMLSTQAMEWRNGSVLADAMNEKYIALASTGRLPFIDAGKKDTAGGGEGDNHVIQIPTLTEYWNTHIKKIWEQDSRFRLPSMPTEITTDPNVPAFFYFDTGRLTAGEHPNWDAWLTRMPEDARAVFRAWIYSIFDPENKGRQMLWLQDRGYSGKSSVFRAIKRYMGGQGVASISKDSMSDKFGYSQVFGKRLVIYGDTKNPKLLHSEKIHSLLGGDPVQIERKHNDAFTAEIHARLIVASNIPPEVDLSARNEVTRLIFVPLHEPPIDVLKQYCQLDAKGDIVRYDNGDPKFIGGNLDELLFEEMDYFLNTCREDYKELCPHHRDIPLPNSLMETLQTRCPSPEHIKMEAFVNERLEFVVEGRCPPMELEKAFQEFGKSRPSSFEMGKLNSYLETLGHTKRKTSKGRYWDGFNIRKQTRQAGGMPT